MTRVPTLTTFTQHSSESSSHNNQTRKIKGIEVGKEKVKLSLFPNDMILYTEKSKDATKRLLKLMN